ncbi:MAG: ATP-binding protein [Polyangiales bacterium]
MSGALTPTSALDFARLFDLLPNPYMLVDREFRYVAANQAYLRVTGARFEDLVGRSLFDVFPNDPGDPRNESARTLRASFERVLASGETDFLAFIPYRVSTDEVRYWSATHVPVLDDAGEVRFILQQTSDVTEMVASEAPQIGAAVLQRAQRVQETNAFLDASLRRLRELFEQAPGFVCALRGPRHVFEFANDAYLDLVGRRDILGLPLVTALPEVVSQGYARILDEVRATGRPYAAQAAEVQLQRVPGAALETRWLTFIYQPIVEDGAVTGIFVQGHDVTEQKLREAERDALYERERAARAEAEQANRLKDEFLATVSHELRTPLSAMLGWVQLLRAGSLPPERRDHALATVERNARAQAQLIEDLLDMSRILAGKLRLDVAPVEVDAVVEAAVDTVRPAAEARGVRLQATLGSGCTVMGDATRLQQIVWNLLSNAIKFTSRGGRVQVVVERRDSAVEVTVADTGKGIALDFLPHVFERFRQAEVGTTRTMGGLGLGLSIVRQLTEMHGGTASAYSEGAGRGSSFTVRLPLSVARRREVVTPPGLQEVARAAGIECPPQLAGMHVLVVDDEQDTREMIQTLLEGCGARITAAASSAEAMRAFGVERPDVILSDVGMPDEDGYTFLQKLREAPEGSDVPAVALTAYARSEDRTRALLAGFNNHIPKPVEPLELLAVLASLARRSRSPGG